MYLIRIIALLMSSLLLTSCIMPRSHTTDPYEYVAILDDTVTGAELKGRQIPYQADLKTGRLFAESTCFIEQQNYTCVPLGEPVIVEVVPSIGCTNVIKVSAVCGGIASDWEGEFRISPFGVEESLIIPWSGAE